MSLTINPVSSNTITVTSECDPRIKDAKDITVYVRAQEKRLDIISDNKDQHIYFQEQTGVIIISSDVLLDGPDFTYKQLL